MAVAFEHLTADMPGEGLIVPTSGGKPVLEEGGGFGSFDAVAECIEDAAVHVVNSRLTMVSPAIIAFRVAIASQAATSPAVAMIFRAAGRICASTQARETRGKGA